MRSIVFTLHHNINIYEETTRTKPFTRVLFLQPHWMCCTSPSSSGIFVSQMASNDCMAFGINKNRSPFSQLHFHMYYISKALPATTFLKCALNYLFASTILYIVNKHHVSMVIPSLR